MAGGTPANPATLVESVDASDLNGFWGSTDFACADPAVQDGERLWRPPVGAAEDAHDRWHDQDPHDGGVDCDRDRQANADGLDDHHVGKGKREEYRHHDRRRTRDEPSALLEAHRNGRL